MLRLSSFTNVITIKRQFGYSLLELTAVVLILGIMAAVMIPDFSSTELTRLDAITQQYVSTFRFTRSESIRSGNPHAFRQTLVNRRLRVASLNETTSPWTLIYDIYHPVTKKLYDYDLDDQSNGRDILLTRTTSYRGTCNNFANLYFDKNGSAWCADPDNVALIRFDLTLSLGSHSRLVSIDGPTGRVTMQ